MANSSSTGVRKKENLKALYNILEYCEEPYLCRRMFQLNFLGEAFEMSGCNQMCDNCAKGLEIEGVEYQEEAIKIVELVKDAVDVKANFTANMARDMLKGRSVKSAYGIPNKLTQAHSGSLK